MQVTKLSGCFGSMSRTFELVSMPATREPRSLLSVDRAISELRRGRMVVIRGHEGRAVLMMAAEAATDDASKNLTDVAGGAPLLAITSRRAAVLGLAQTDGNVTLITPAHDDIVLDADQISLLADPTGLPDADQAQSLLADISQLTTETYSCESAAVQLTKHARLLPAALVADISDPNATDLTAWAARHDLFETDAGDIFQHEKTVARTLSRVSEARVPLFDAENTRIIAYRPKDGGLEHLAIVIGEPSADDAVLVRLHSECFTGDLLGSLKCDCGDQLRGAIAEISSQGTGVLLYLAQEGRGIGLVNKLRAYELQDRGFDTLDANEQLGFDADERVYLPAAQMLRELGYARIRLLTNNPDKVSAMAACGIDVAERVQHAFPANKHNEQYLDTKVRRSGHLI
jgi:GTP cyclohydrolase II